METPIKERCIYNGKIIRVVCMDVRQTNGREAKREIVRHPGGSAVVAHNAHNDIALVRQYRAAMGRFMLELPAGKLDKGEDPLACAMRELKEETGLLADEWKKLGEYVSSPGFCDEIIHLFMAKGNEHGERHFDEDEYVDVIWMPFQEAVKLVIEGKIADGKTISGILLAKQAYLGDVNE